MTVVSQRDRWVRTQLYASRQLPHSVLTPLGSWYASRHCASIMHVSSSPRPWPVALVRTSRAARSGYVQRLRTRVHREGVTRPLLSSRARTCRRHVDRSPSSLAATERGLSDLDQMPSPNIASNCAAWSQLRSRLGDHGLDEAVVVDLAVVVGDGLLDHLVHLAGSGAGDWARGSRAGVRPSTRRADEGRSEGA